MNYDEVESSLTETHIDRSFKYKSIDNKMLCRWVYDLFILRKKRKKVKCEEIVFCFSATTRRKSLSHSSQRSNVDNMPDIVILHRIFSLTSKSTHNFHASQELWASQHCWQHSYWRVSLSRLTRIHFKTSHSNEFYWTRSVDVWYLHHHNSNIHKTFYCAHCCHVGHISQNVSQHHIP